jgi:hypothetical protein
MKSTLIALVVFASLSMSALASVPRRRSVDMEITLPNGAATRVTVPEDEGVVVKLVDGTRFGFVPTLPHDDDSPVVVSIWDVDRKPIRKLGSLTVEVGGESVHTDTSPSFGVRVVRIIKPK